MDQRALNISGSGGDIIGMHAQSRSPATAYLNGPCEGISLTVDECGSQPAQTLKFWKSNTRVVEIGRRSAQAKGNEPDGKQALFRCPVISRKHAKITFSEFGNVCFTTPLLATVVNIHL